jgi:hypothetical protein
VIIHLQKFGCELETLTTHRVTLLEDRLDLNQPAGRILVLGTRPDIKTFPLTDIQWFWVEEE